jgi:hypothetical protein
VSITKERQNKAAVSGVEVGEMAAQLMNSRKTMHGAWSRRSTVGVFFSKKNAWSYTVQIQYCVPFNNNGTNCA